MIGERVIFFNRINLCYENNILKILELILLICDFVGKRKFDF